MSNVSVTLACGPYDQMEALSRALIKPLGIDLTFLGMRSPPEIFARMIKTRAFDISEMSLSSYFNLRARGNFPFIALPVFPCRVFRHSYIFVNRKKKIWLPKDLEGQKIGVQQYRQTAGIWIRGILSEKYNVDFSNVSWIEGGVNTPREPDKDMDLVPDTEIKLHAAPKGQTINELLKSGEISAYLGARAPSCFKFNDHIDRLFPEYRKVERAYHDETKIFPIMHTLVMREDLHAEKPWIAENMVDAIEKSKRWAMEQMRFTGTMRYMIPWLNHEIEELDNMFKGGDPYPNGVEANRQVLETLMKYLVSQNFVQSPRPPIDDFFVPIVGWVE